MSKEEIAVRLTEAILSNPSLNVAKAAEFAVSTYQHIVDRIEVTNEKGEM